jgi:enamine deaminase RidA (YjgF/YER057c/UK114 family)
MTKQTVEAQGVSVPAAPYSQALTVEARRTLHISGQVPVDQAGNLIGLGDVEAQAAKVFDNIRSICEAAGGSLDSLVFLRIYLTDMGFRPAITKIRNELLKPPYPAATMVQVSALADENWLVEIEAEAALD